MPNACNNVGDSKTDSRLFDRSTGFLYFAILRVNRTTREPLKERNVVGDT